MAKKTEVPELEEKENAETPKTFTQEEVNVLVGRTRQEVRAQFGDYDKLKERAATADKLESAQLSEKDRLSKQLAEAQRKAADTELRVAETAINAEIRLTASRMGLIDPDAAAALVARTGISYAEDRVTGVDEALTALVASKPWLKAVAKAPNLNAGEGHPSPAPVKLTPEQLAVAAKLGVKPENYAKHV